MTIIEFFGCPGSGKSSICRLVMEGLAAEGYTVRNIHRNELRKGKLSRKILSAKALTSRRTHGLKKAVDDYAATLPKQHCPWKRDIINSAYKLGQRYVKETDYVLFDEGPTQYITSIPHSNKVTDKIKPLIREVNRAFYGHKVVAFYVVAGRNEIIERLRRRGKPGDRFVTEDEDEMRQLIDTKISNIEYISEMLGYSELHRIENDDLDRAAKEVIRLILKGNEA